VLENRLRGCRQLAGKTPETLNFGVSGYGTAQRLVILQTRVWKYHPDMVLLAVFPGNDIRNNRASLNHEPFCPYLLLSRRQVNSSAAARAQDGPRAPFAGHAHRA